MVQYIKSDLEFILDQIKIAEAHAGGQPLYGPGGLIPTYNLAWGLRTVDGSYNNLLNPDWGSSDQPFIEGLGTDFRTLFVDADSGPGVMMVPMTYTPGVDNDGPTMTVPGPNGPMEIGNRAGPGDVIDPEPRIISNLIVDQTLGNPSAILTALQRAGVADPGMLITASIADAYAPLRLLFDALSAAERVYANASAAAAASPTNAALQQAAADALEDVTAAHSTLEANAGYDALLTLLGDNGIELDGINIVITNTAPDEGLSAPFNSWFTLFGQFFDHGLDLVGKGGSGTVMVPLMPDDPLYVVGSATNFMVLTRATVGPGPDGIMVDNPLTTGVDESADNIRPINTTTPFVDQNQTYTSHASHQVFLREYAFNASGEPVATGELIQGAQGGMATWKDLKAQAADLLGIQLLDKDVGNVPLLLTDPYGEFIRGPNGFVQIMTTTGLVEANPADNGGLGTLLPANTLRTGHAFLADIAHSAVPEGVEDGDIEIGLENPGNTPGVYDNELLDAHYVAGDGRANENIGLTAVHHVFHAEHNRLVEHTKVTVLETKDLAFINEWLLVDLTEAQVNALPTVPTDPAAREAFLNTFTWDGERVFQAAKFGTEMQYQHLVFEEFARKIQPNINVFLVPDGFDVTIDPSIVAEFAHVVYRFGHSMLTESIDRFDPQFDSDHIGLIEGFLNPIQFENNGGLEGVDAHVTAGAIIRGMTRQAGNEIDEFVTSALRNNLLGLPLDLATINLARGRDAGVPTLNAARASFYAATDENSLLKPYESWVDFAGHLKHEASIINFVAAYGSHALITDQTTVEGKRDAALTIITGVSVGGLEVPPDAEAFLNGLGGYAGDLGGLNNVDLWIGGLAEEIMPFGGMLGSTFNFVFETQMESLQNGDRFYYLQRLDGLHLFSEMEANSFAGMIMRNTDATHLPSDVFSTPGLILEVDRTKQYNAGLGETAGADGILEDDPTTAANEAADNEGIDPTGGGILTPLVIRNNPATVGPDTNYLRYTGDEHVLLGGTEAGDTLIASIGDDTLFGDGGNDKLEGGFGNDIINGGDGDDIIRDTGGDDNIKGGKGNDAIHAGPGLDLVLSGDGQDFVILGTDMGSEVFGGVGNDFILGNKNAERILGNEGDDWLETGTFDGAPGDNFDEIFARDGIDGNDVFLGDGGFDEFIGEGGDDIFVGSPGRGKMAGMSGFDWVTYKDNTAFVNADLSVPIVFDEAPTLPQNTTLDEFESVQGLSGTRFNDVLSGSNEDAASLLPLAQGGGTGYLGSALDAQGIALIGGLQAVVGAGVTSFAEGDIILGGDGSDIIQGNGGNDIIDGDKWLDVQIGVYALADTAHTGDLLKTVNSMKELTAEVFAGTINPGQLGIVRSIKTDTTTGDIDTAKYVGLRGEYAFSATADGQVIVTHAIEDALDGSDRLRNIEKIQFADGSALNIIVGTAYSDNGLPPQGPGPLNQPALNGTAQDDLILGLAGADILNGGAGNDILVGGAGGSTTTSTSATSTFADNFNSSGFGNSTGSVNWGPDWVESDDDSSATNGQIRIDGATDTMRFVGGGGANGATITRAIDLASANSVTITFSANPDNLEETVLAEFSPDGTTWVEMASITGNGGSVNYTHTATGPFPNASIRFSAGPMSATDDIANIDNLVISRTIMTVTTTTAGDILNGGLGDDTYSFTLGDGNDTINEAVNATSGGTADRISILAPTTGIDPLTDLPIQTINNLNAFDSNTGTNNGDLVINYGLPDGANSVAQSITVAGHFAGNTAGTGVERINFNGAQVQGYQLGTDDYLISRLDPNNRDSGGVNLAASTANNFVVGEQGVNDVITGGSGNDLIFGGTGNNDLVGGLGDDLLVGGTGNDDLDARLNAAQDDFEAPLGADTMIGGAGNDTYGVDDLLDVVVEAANEGTDEVQTFMAALSIETMTNVENLTYIGVDADQFVGTGNSLNNIISGGDLADTLIGLGGNDTLNGGLGADIMTGGDGNDIYEVDEAGDVVTETNADLVLGGADRVESDIDYTLGANFENLDLNGTAVRGTGNTLNNVINGNGENNQLFGAGGNDTLAGDDGNDLLDGGDGNDTLNGGDDNDIIIGGAGADTIDVGGGLNTIVYNASGFGADVINSFDSTGGTAANQDKIDLSGLGVTAANFANRVFESASGANTLITIREGGPASTIQGTILINSSNTAAIDITDFTLAAAAPTSTITGSNAANTLNGVGNTSETINALGGNDTVNANGGNDVVSGGEGADTLNGGDGNDTLSGGAGSDAGTYADNFGAASYANSDGTIAFAGNWSESGAGEATSPTAGDIQIAGGRLQFAAGIDGNEIIQRSINLAGATAATLSFSYEGDDLDAGESVVVEAFNGTVWQTLGTLGGDTNATVNFSAPLTAAHTAIRLRAVGTFEAGENFFVDNFVVNVTVPGLNVGVDTVNGGAGDDTIIWSANAAAPTDGRDIVNGGTEGAVGDTLVINGNASAETYRIYTRAAATAAGIASAATTEIVVTRGVAAGVAVVIAELSEIEEIRLNGIDPSGPAGTAGNDNFEIIGDFSATSLRLNTITIDGATGNDTINISSLSSAHRIVFRSNGGNDTIIGTMRPQDLIELPTGANAADYVSTTANGITTMTNGTHTITFTAPEGPPQVSDPDDSPDPANDEDGTDVGGGTLPPPNQNTGNGASPPPFVVYLGTAGGGTGVGGALGDILSGLDGADALFGMGGDDSLVGQGGNDNLVAGDGNDLVFGDDGNDLVLAGAGDDTVFGGNGNDTIWADGGNDRITGGEGSDVIDAGDGNDTIYASLDDGNDVISGGAGADTIDYQAITAALTINLGANGSGSANSAQSGNDALNGIENVKGGTGNDTIYASNAHNVLDAGLGEDTFVFNSAAAADGDRIDGFTLGDTIDLTPFMPVPTGGTFVADSATFNLAGQVKLVFVGEDTRVDGNTDADGDVDFSILVTGRHLTVNDFA